MTASTLRMLAVVDAPTADPDFGPAGVAANGPAATAGPLLTRRWRLSGRDVAGDVDDHVSSGRAVDTDSAASTDFGEHCVRYDIARPVVDT